MKCDKCEKKLVDVWFPIGLCTPKWKQFLMGMSVNTYCKECYKKILNGDL